MAAALPMIDMASALFLDVDGTLLDIAPTPDAVIVPAQLKADLAMLHVGLGGALALVSGRSIGDLDQLFAPLRLPCAGQHGAEVRRHDGASIAAAPRPPRLDAMIDRLRRFAAARPGILVEDKGASIAAHYRLAPQCREALRELITGLANDDGETELLPILDGFELRPRGVTKRRAVEWLMREPPFLDRRPVFVGDDRTDEEGFAAALALGGCAIHVGPAADTIADIFIATPGAARRWLGAVATTLSRH